MPLDGLRVIELATVLAGPAVGMFCAELGAEVIKVEPPAGDVTRRWKLPTESAESPISAYYAAVNWGKRHVVLDLNAPGDADRLADLLGSADVLVTNFMPRSLAKFGLATDVLRRRFPQLVIAHITGYGPDSDRTGYDAIVQAEAGFVGLNGPAEGAPEKMPVALMDLLAAHQAKEGLLAALLNRTRSREGALVEVSLIQSGISSLANQATSWLWAGHPPRRMGSAHPQIAPYGTIFYDASELPLMLAVGTDAQFSALCQVLGLPEMAADERFRTNPARVKHRPALEARLAQAIAGRERAELLAHLAAQRIPAGAVRAIEEVTASPSAEGLLLTHPEAFGQALRSVAVHGLGNPPPLSPPKSPGADNSDVFGG